MKVGQLVKDKVTKKHGRLCRVIPRYDADEALWVVRLDGGFTEACGRNLTIPMPEKVVHRLELDLESA